MKTSDTLDFIKIWNLDTSKTRYKRKDEQNA